MSNRARLLGSVAIAFVFAGAANVIATAQTAAPKARVAIVYAHVDFKSANTPEGSGLVVVLPKSGKVDQGSGVIWPCGSDKPVPYTAPPDVVSQVSDSPCTPKKPAKWTLLFGTTPWIILVPKVLYPGSAQIDPQAMKYLDVKADVKRDTGSSSSLQAFADNSTTSLTIGQLKYKLKTAATRVIVASPR